MGLPRQIYKLGRNYVLNRTQYVYFYNSTSGIFDNTAGVPAFTFRAIAFIIYVNDIITSSKLFALIVFADDTTLITTIDTQDTEF